MSRAPLVARMLLLLTLVSLGCGTPDRPARPRHACDPVTPHVKAQGTLQPLNGILNITALPGDEIESILVQEGDEVTPPEPDQVEGTLLAVLKSRTLRQIEMELANARVAEAQQRIKAERLAAQAKLDGAKLSGSEASLQQEELKNQEEGLKLFKQQREQAVAKLASLKQLRGDKLTKDVTSQQDVDNQQLLVNKLRADIEQGQKLLDAARASQANAATAATAQEAAAAHSHENVRAISPLASLEQAAVLAKLNLDMTEIKSPISGTVLRVIARPNDRVTNMPLMQIADTTKMACVAEVYESNLQHVEPDDRVTICSPALKHKLQGRVLSKGAIIGRPRLPNPNPLSRQDVRTGEVVIQLDEGDSTELAAQYINLQVDVTIETESAETESAETKSADTESAETE